MIGESRHFPSGALRDRMRAEVEPALGSSSWVVLAPVCAAALATFVAIRFVPAAHVHDNRVDGPPWLLSLGLAVFGAVIGIFLVGGGLWVWLWRRYLKHGDPRFTAGATHPHGDRFPLGLTYSGDRAFDAGTLGSYQGANASWVRQGRLRCRPNEPCVRAGRTAARRGSVQGRAGRHESVVRGRLRGASQPWRSSRGRLR